MTKLEGVLRNFSIDVSTVFLQEDDMVAYWNFEEHIAYVRRVLSCKAWKE